MNDCSTVCCICLSSEGQLVKSTTCHCAEALFHQDCVDQYVKSMPRCPICKKVYSGEEVIEFQPDYLILSVMFLVLICFILIHYLLVNYFQSHKIILPSILLWAMIFFVLSPLFFTQEIREILARFVPINQAWLRGEPINQAG